MRTSLAFVAVAVSVVLSGCALVIADLNPFERKPESLRETVLQGKGDDKIVLIDISRVISADEEEGALGLRRRESTVSRVAQVLDQAGDDEDVKALVLRINSQIGRAHV